MTIDMSQFYETFFDEAGEHLASMESLLLGLHADQPNFDDLNAIFRAAHSIKGGAGTFGFTDLAGVTHILENLLDRLRKAELQLTSEMVDAFLAAGDVLKGQLHAHKTGTTSDQGAASEICQRLERLTGGVAAAVPPPTCFPGQCALRTGRQYHWRSHCGDERLRRYSPGTGSHPLSNRIEQ